MKTWSKTPLLLIPVENQVRELDAKLLLACVAANRGLSSIVGPKREVEFRIASFPRSIFLSKSLRIGNRKFFPVSRMLGHEIVAWDEEALVHLPPEIYFPRRLSAAGMHFVSRLFAWGEDNAALWRQYPNLPSHTPIHVTGNPRNDLLRPEIRAYYDRDVDRIQSRFGDFILVNTNFNHVNAFYPAQGLFLPAGNGGERAEFGQAARGMPRDYAEGLRDHKLAVFGDFKRLIADLDRAFPDVTVVVRPHPTENQAVYKDIAARCRRVTVTNDGNVVPWLMAARCVIHNGCTTGVEAHVMGVPAISYRASVNDLYDDGFYRLPNRLSHQCFSFEDLREVLESILRGALSVSEGKTQKAILDHHLAALDGPLACERIVDGLEEMARHLTATPEPKATTRFRGWFLTTRRRLRQRMKSRLPGATKSTEFEQHRYPDIPLEDIASRLDRFQQVLGNPRSLKIQSVFGNLFKISC